MSISRGSMMRLCAEEGEAARLLANRGLSLFKWKAKGRVIFGVIGPDGAAILTTPKFKHIKKFALDKAMAREQGAKAVKAAMRRAKSASAHYRPAV